jgi:hypothetical protein
MYGKPKRTNVPVKISLLLLFTSWVAASHAGAIQLVTPSDRAKLSTMQILFDWLTDDNADHYELELIREISGQSASGWDKKLISVDNPPLILSHIFDFGQSYVWRVRTVSEEGTARSWSGGFRFSLKELPTLPSLEITRNKPLLTEPGLTLFHKFAVDNLGKVVLFHQPEGPGPRWNIELLPNGNLLYIADGYIQEASLCGEEVVFRSPEGDYHHDVRPMPGGGYLALQHDHRELPLDGETMKWWGDRLVHLNPDGSVKWSWSVFDHLSPDDIDPDHAELGQLTGFFDWTHVNSCVYLPHEEAVVISIRNLSRIIKIDYNSGEIIWSVGKRLASGEAAMGDGLFDSQHAASILTNGHLLLYDNRGNDLTLDPSNSRVLEIAFDNPQNPNSTSVAWRYNLPYFASIYGDADRLANGNTLITGAPKADPDRRIHEVTADGTTVWELRTNMGLYRAERIKSLYPNVFSGDRTKPVFHPAGPVSGNYINAAMVSYRLSETLFSGRITFRRTGGAADPASPQVMPLYGSELNAGDHKEVRLTYQPTLVDGAVYSVSFDGVDYASNVAETATIEGIRVDLSPPHEPSDLTATAGIGEVVLNWTANNEADLSHYLIFRSSQEDGSRAQIIMSVAGADTAAADLSPKNLGIYWYWLKAVDLAQNASLFSRPDSAAVVSGTTGIDRTGKGVPVDFNLRQNYPNPFNPRTTIEFALPRESAVSLSIYNALGQRVRELATGRRAAGSHRVEWDGRDDYGQEMSSGIYFYAIEADRYRRIRRMVLLK